MTIKFEKWMLKVKTVFVNEIFEWDFRRGCVYETTKWFCLFKECWTNM